HGDIQSCTCLKPVDHGKKTEKGKRVNRVVQKTSTPCSGSQPHRPEAGSLLVWLMATIAPAPIQVVRVPTGSGTWGVDGGGDDDDGGAGGALVAPYWEGRLKDAMRTGSMMTRQQSVARTQRYGADSAGSTLVPHDTTFHVSPNGRWIMV